MARVPYLEMRDDPELSKFLAQFEAKKGRRFERGDHMWQLYSVLLHNPAIATGWINLMEAVRLKGQIPTVDQELVIMLIAVINQSRFEYTAHTRPALAAGVTQSQIDALPDWRNSQEFNQRQRAILTYAEVMTRAVVVPEQVFEGVRAIFDAKQLVELTALIAVYNFTMRLTVALQLGS